MFGLFRKNEDYHLYINTGMYMMEDSYKSGLRASNDILLAQYSGQICSVYLKTKPLYEVMNSYTIMRPHDRSSVNPQDREKIVHCLMLIDSFACGLQGRQLDEKMLRKMVEKDCELIFTRTNSFASETQGLHRRVYGIMKDIYFEFNPPEFPSMRAMM